MMEPLTLVQQARTRLLRQKQVNAVGFFIPLACSGWIFGRLLFDVVSFPYLFLFFFPAGCTGFLWAALWKARNSVNLESTATLLDGKMRGQERFLTLVSLLPEKTAEPFFSLVQKQTAQLSISFLPNHDLPLKIDRRVLLAVCGGLISTFLWLFFPYMGYDRPSLFSLPSTKMDTGNRFQEENIMALEKTARDLMQESSTPQQQVLGAQLLALAQQLKDPSLSPQEKEKLIEETQKRIKLDLPLPQILPFDLKIFASDNKEGKGSGDGEDSTQKGQTRSSETKPSDGQPQSSPSSTAPGNESQQETNPSGEKSKQPQPQNGGGVTFNFPQPQTKNQEQSPQEPSGAGQQPSQNQPQQGLAPGSDPNRLGGNQNNQTQAKKNQQGESDKPGNGQNKDSEGGAKVGQGKGQRFSQPGEKAGGGFLTEAARFVKIRVPLGQETQGEGASYTENTSRTAPKTPYSNAPLKEGDPEQARAKQPVPLEYRSIFKE